MRIITIIFRILIILCLIFNKEFIRDDRFYRILLYLWSRIFNVIFNRWMGLFLDMFMFYFFIVSLIYYYIFIFLIEVIIRMYDM